MAFLKELLSDTTINVTYSETVFISENHIDAIDETVFVSSAIKSISLKKLTFHLLIHVGS